MAVASVTKITAARPRALTPPFARGGAGQENLVRHHRTSRNRAQGERGERKNRGIQGDHGGDLHPRKLAAAAGQTGSFSRRESSVFQITCYARAAIWSLLKARERTILTED